MKYCFYCQQELREEQYYCGNCGHWRGAEEDEPQAPSVSTSLDAVGVCPECLRDIAADEQTIRCKKCGAEYHVHCFDSITECVAPACIGEREATGGDREKIAEMLTQYTGLSMAFVEDNNLRITRSAFMNELLRAEHLSVGLVDSRATSSDHTGDFLSDPGVVMTVAPYTAALNDYVRDELKFESDLPYVFLSEEANGQWNWGSAIHGYVSVLDTFHKVINRSPYLRVFAACGYYDLDTPYLGTRYALNHVGLDPKLQNNITVQYYEGGHMLYTHRPSLQRLTEDVKAFLKSAIPAGS